jgi:hypothetical protein
VRLFALVVHGVFLAAPVLGQEELSPGVRFLRAADAGDFHTMAALLDPESPINAATILEKTKSCYVRSAFATPEGTVVAAWMCAEPEGKSRVLMTEIGDGASGAEVQITREYKQSLPFLPRTRSVLNEGKPNG